MSDYVDLNDGMPSVLFSPVLQPSIVRHNP
jgi:hypothetical protein